MILYLFFKYSLTELQTIAGGKQIVVVPLSVAVRMSNGVPRKFIFFCGYVLTGCLENVHRAFTVNKKTGLIIRPVP